MKKIKILFLAHEASLSGAPFVLVNFARWIKLHKPHVEMDILLLRGGNDIKTYFEIFNNVDLIGERDHDNLVLKLFSKIRSRTKFSRNNFLFKKLSKKQYKLIYSNTTATVAVGVQLKQLFVNAKLLVHIHELRTAINILEPNFQALSTAVDRFIAVSSAVRNTLHETYEIALSKIDLIYAFIDSAPSPVVDRSSDVFTIGASGLVNWRKGYDLFLLIAYLFKNRYSHLNVKFNWVGKVPVLEGLIVKEEIIKLNIEDTVTFSGETTNPYDEFKKFDLFLLTSREDPFPLVCLEVARIGIPIICFEKSGGAAELLADGGGTIVPYSDIDAVLNAIHTYYIDRKKLCEDGVTIKRSSMKYSLDICAPKVFKVLDNLLNTEV